MEIGILFFFSGSISLMTHWQGPSSFIDTVYLNFFQKLVFVLPEIVANAFNITILDIHRVSFILDHGSVGFSYINEMADRPDGLFYRSR